MEDDPDAVSAAYAFVESMVPAAHLDASGYPAWHGWAMRAAYLAGYQSAGKRIADLEAELRKAMEAHEEP